MGRASHQQVITTRWWRLGRVRTGVGESEPPTSHNNSLVAIGAGEDWGWGEKPPTSHNNSLVAVGAGEDRGWGEKPPTSHNDSLVVGTRRAGAREDPPMSVLLVGGGCEEGGTGLGRANHQRVITTRWWRLGRVRTGAGEKNHQRVIMTHWWLEQGGPG